MKKKVVRFDFWLNPAFDTHMRSLSDIDLTVCSHGDDDARNLDALRDAHVYHICAARDEVPSQWWVTDELLAQLPDLLCASSSGAGLDVWTVEPPARDNPLLTLPNVTATYHTAGVTHEARRNAATMAAEQIEAMLRGEPAPRVVNPEVWPVFLERHRRLFGKA